MAPDNYSKGSCKDGSTKFFFLVAEVKRNVRHKEQSRRFRLELSKIHFSKGIVSKRTRCPERWRKISVLGGVQELIRQSPG